MTFKAYPQNSLNLKGLMILLFFLFVTAILYAQSEKKVTVQEVQNVFAILFTEPEKALRQLQDLEKRSVHQRDSIYGLILNYKGIYYASKNELSESLSYFEKAKEFLEIIPERHIKVLNNIAIIYRKKGDYIKSLSVFTDAETLALQRNQPELLGLIYGEMASLYSSIQSYEKATTILLKSLSYWEKSTKSHPVSLAIDKQKLGNLYWKMGQYNFALELLEQSKKILQESSRPDAYALTLTSLAEVYGSLSLWDKTLEVLHEATVHLERYQNPEWDAYVMEIMARTYAQKNDHQKATQFFKKSLDIAIQNKLSRALFTFTKWGDYTLKSKKEEELKQLFKQYDSHINQWMERAVLEDKREFYALKAHWEQINKNFLESNEAYALLVKYNDSLQNLYNRNVVWDLQLQYQSTLKEKENIILQQELTLEQKRKGLIFVVLMLTLCLSALLWWYFKMQHRLKKQEVVQWQLQASIVENELIQTQEIAKFRKEVIEEREQDLMKQTLENLALKEQLDEVIQNITKENNQEALQKIKTIKQKHLPWKSVLERFQQVNPEFVQKLHEYEPDLTKKDIEFCTMVRMNLSNKDMAGILQISVDSIFTKKYRLMKKLNLPKDQDLFIWLNSL